MDDEQLYSILSEQEPDFSALIAKDIEITDLDSDAFNRMKNSYIRKQGNALFDSLSNKQILSDLNLYVDGRLTNASVILLGKKEIINKYLPQCKIIWEFREEEYQISFDNRQVLEGPLYLVIDQIWDLVNNSLLNKKQSIQSGAYIFDVYNFNKEVIREAILNAIAHRDYKISSEIVIKQYKNKIEIINPGGFPRGVTIENILTVSSTPRSRLMTEVLEKTGLVERSGQGVDKIYSITLSEGKGEPDYKESDMYQVKLVLNAQVLDKAFHSFINSYQTSNRNQKLGVEQIITLYKIRIANFNTLNKVIVGQLEDLGLIRKVNSSSIKYLLGEEFLKLEDKILRIGKRYLVKEIEGVLKNLQGRELKIGELEERLKEELNRNQIKYLLSKLIEDNILITVGQASGTKYKINKEYDSLRGIELYDKVIACLNSIY